MSVASVTVARSMAGLLQKPKKLLQRLRLAIDDQDIRHIK